LGAGVSFVLPDYNPGTIEGYSVYGNYDFTAHFGIEGAIHGATLITPTDIAESSYLLGPRYVFHRKRLHPYGKVLFGLGVFTFEPVPGNPTARTSTHRMYALGGGLDFTYKRHVNIRVIDLEYQRWPGFGAGGLTPIAITVGAAYSF